MEFIDRNRFRNITSNIYRSIGIANDDYRTFAKGRPFNYVRIYNPTGGIRQEFKDNLYYDLQCNPQDYLPCMIRMMKQIEKEEDPIKQNKLIAQQNKLLSYISGLGIGVGTEDKVLLQRLKSFKSKV